jgi:hypothetical protein
MWSFFSKQKPEVGANSFVYEKTRELFGDSNYCYDGKYIGK